MEHTTLSNNNINFIFLELKAYSIYTQQLCDKFVFRTLGKVERNFYPHYIKRLVNHKLVYLIYKC
jgi:hypothetical protein